MRILTILIFAFMLASCVSNAKINQYPNYQPQKILRTRPVYNAVQPQFKPTIPAISSQQTLDVICLKAKQGDVSAQDYLARRHDKICADDKDVINDRTTTINEATLTNGTSVINEIKEATFTKCGDSYLVYTDSYGHIYDEPDNSTNNSFGNKVLNLNEFKGVKFSIKAKQVNTKVTEAERLNGLATHERQFWDDWVGHLHMEAQVFRQRGIHWNGKNNQVEWDMWRDDGKLGFSVKKTKGSWTYRPGDYIDFDIKTTKFRKPSCNELNPN